MQALERNAQTPLDPDVRMAVYTTASHSGDPEIYAQVWPHVGVGLVFRA